MKTVVSNKCCNYLFIAERKTYALDLICLVSTLHVFEQLQFDLISHLITEYRIGIFTSDD